LTSESVVAIILARGGSKGIPKKNLRLFGGSPLVEWCLNAAIKSQKINSVILSSDSDEILDCGRKLGCELHKRSDEHSQDTTTSEESMLAVINEHPIAQSAEVLILVQPTSPFTKPEDFDAALELFENGRFDSLVTGVSDHSFSWEVDEVGNSIPKYNPKSRPRRQDMKSLRKENGAFYITKRKIWDEEKCRLGGKIGFYVMEPYQSIEIDSEFDWILLEQLINHNF
jgi:CMP-N-acetylneuraminic acid synthetase